MRKNYILTTIISTILLTSLITLPSSYAVDFISVDLGEALNPNDFAYGITCQDPDRVMGTLFNGGELFFIDKSDLSTGIIGNPKITDLAGNDFSSIVYNPDNDKSYVTERDNGLVWEYDQNLDLWTEIAVVPFVNHAKVKYPNTYATDPTTIKVEGEATHGDHTYNFGTNNFAGIIYTNSHTYSGLNVDLNFDSEAEALGVTDVSFDGLVKIDPDTHDVTRIAIPNAIDIRGIDIDNENPNHIWFTSGSNDKLFKFDTTTDTVLEEIDLPSGTNPNGLDDTTTDVYVSANNNISANSEIIKVSKSDTSQQTVIDTTAENTNFGTFTTFVFQNFFLVWSDQSGHVGTINLTNNQKAVFDTSHADSNHFACYDNVTDTVYVAGEGSAVVTPISVPSRNNGNENSDDNGNGSQNAFKTRPTMGLDHHTGNRLVENAICVNDYCQNADDGLHTTHTEFPETNLLLGETNTISSKSYAVHDLSYTEYSFGCVDTRDTTCDVSIEVWYDNDEQVDDTILNDPDGIIDRDSVSATSQDVSCGTKGKSTKCNETTVSFIMNDVPMDKVFTIEITDIKRRANFESFNDGIQFVGTPLIEPKTAYMADNGKLVKLFHHDRTTNIWTDESGIQYLQNSFGTFIRITPVPHERQNDGTVNVMERNHSEFDSLAQYEQNRAKYIWNGESILNGDKGYFIYDYPEIDSRTQFLEKHNLIDFARGQ